MFITFVCAGSSGIKPVAQTLDRYEKDLTSDEKLAIYEYVIRKAKEQGHASNVPLEDLAFDPTPAGQKGASFFLGFWFDFNITKVGLIM